MAKRRIRQIIITVVLVAVFLALGFVAVNMFREGSFSLPYIGTIGRNLEPETEELTQPGEIAAGNGSGSYCLVDPDRSYGTTSSNGRTVYETLLSWLGDYMDGGAEAEKINGTEYIRAVTGNTITAIYDCDIPFRDFIRHNDMKMPGGETIQNVTRIVLSDNGGGTVLLYDGNKNRYYKISRSEGTGGVTSSRIEKMVGFAEKNGTNGYGTHSGVLTGENELTYQSDSDAPELTAESFEPEYHAAGGRAAASLENMFFPGGLDFVHKVEGSDGSITYMYGSREKVLRIDGSSGFTYTIDTDNRPADRLISPDFYTALSDSVKYIKNHGGWISKNNIQMKLNGAKRLSASGDRAAGYRFTFCLQLDGLQLMYGEGSEMYVEIRGGRVTAYHRDLPDVESLPETSGKSVQTKDDSRDDEEKDSDTEKTAQDEKTGELQSLSEVLYENRQVIADAAGTAVPAGTEKRDSGSEETDDRENESVDAEYVASLLDDLSAARLCLYRTDSDGLQNEESDDSDDKENTETVSDNEESSEKQTLADNGSDFTITPAWYIKAGDHVFWFSAVTGELLAEKS